jgi:hypothetical protein
MMKKLLASLFITTSFIAASIAVLPGTVLAANSENCQKQSDNFLKFPTWYKYLNPVFIEADPNADPPRFSSECKISFPKDSNNKESLVLAVGPILLAVFEIILRIGGIAAVGFIIFGGFQYLLSQGEPEQTKGAKSTILNAVIGLAIMLSAVAIVNIIGRNIS